MTSQKRHVQNPETGFEDFLVKNAPDVDRGYVDCDDEKFFKPVKIGMPAGRFAECMIRTFVPDFIDKQKHPIVIKLYSKGPAADIETHMYIRIEQSGNGYFVRYGKEEYMQREHKTTQLIRIELLFAMHMLWKSLINSNQ